MKRSSRPVAGMLGLALFAAAVQGQDMPAFPPAQVEVAIAQTRQMAPVVTVSGTVISLNDSRIAAEVEGVLTWTAQVGDRVEAEQVIARIDPRLLDIAVRRAGAEVARLQAQLHYREQQLKRNLDLAKTNNASATLVDEARYQRDASRHQLADARAHFERAESDQARAEIRAPFAGHVTQRLAFVGEYVAVGEVVIRLVDTHNTEIALPAPMTLAPFLSPGLLVDVSHAGVRRQHPVRTVVPVGEAVSRMLEVRLSAQSDDWLVGTPVQVSLPRDHPFTAVAVPRDALVERSGSSYVYKVKPDGTAQQVQADIRSTVGLWIALSEGVEAGEQVIVRGAERLSPGQPVTITAGAEGR